MLDRCDTSRKYGVPLHMHLLETAYQKEYARRRGGWRVSYSYAVRDQNRLVYQRDEEFIASLPSDLRGPMQRWFERFQLTLDDDIALFEGLYGAPR